MSKTKTKISQISNKSINTKSKTPKTRKLEDENFTKYDSLIYLGIIIFAVLIFFREGIFSGKVFTSGDHIAFNSFKTFLDDANKEGVFALWTPYIFLGMPNFAGLIGFSPRSYDFFSNLWNTIIEIITGSSSNPVFSIAIYYVVFGIGFYFYANYKFKNKLIALFCSLSGVFATDYIQRIVAGHNTKVLALMFFPLILLIVERLIDYEYKNKFQKILEVSLLAILLHIQLNSNHMQMIFYSYLFIGMYILYIFIYRLIKKIKIKTIINAAVLFIIATIISIAMDADVLMSVKEYSKYSIRGVPGITSQLDTKVKNDTPLDYQYATNWSFSPGEVATFLLPYYYGFGDVEVQGQRTNLYWGQMPFTSSPMYFGIVTLVLAIIGIIYNFKKNVSAQALTIISFIFLLLSFGRNFSVLFDLFFYYFPFFSSFRAPVMIHNYMDVAFTILAGFGIKSILEVVKDNSQVQKFKKLAFTIIGIFGIIFFISLIGFESSYSASVASSPIVEKLKMQGVNSQQISQYTKQISSIAYGNILSDMRLHSIMIIVLIGLGIMYSQRKISLKLFLIITLFLCFFDQWNVNAKTIHWDNKKDSENTFTETDYTNWLLKNNPNNYEYRVVEFNSNAYSSGQPATNNILAYYRLQLFNGYQGAKIRIYQDALDVVGANNTLLLGLANVKYILSPTPIQDSSLTQVFKGNYYIYENKTFLPRAFFVDTYQVEPGINILNNIKQKNFDPRKIAFVESDINMKIDEADSNATVKLIKADIHSYEYDVAASGNNLLFMSDVYYPAGWKAYIDGAETEIYKTNYLFRSIVIPKGKHKIGIKFSPETYNKGKVISLGANILLGIILLTGGVGLVLTKRKNIKGNK